MDGFKNILCKTNKAKNTDNIVTRILYNCNQILGQFY
jgi:hypothetical protein